MADPLFMPYDREDAILAGWRRRQAQQAQARAQANRATAERAVALAAQVPNASGALVVGGAVAGMPAEQVAQLAEREPQGRSFFDKVLDGVASGVGLGTEAVGGGWAQFYERALKPAIRGAFIVADTIAQEALQRPITAASAAIGDGDGNNVTFGQAYRDYGNSEGVTAFERLREQAAEGGLASAARLLTQGDDAATEEDESFLGTGFFPGGQVAADAYDQRTLTIDGQRANLGRAMPLSRGMAWFGEELQQPRMTPTAQRFGEFISPGGQAHDVVSGVTQFAGDVFLDPTVALSGGTKAGATVVGKGVRAAGGSARTAARAEQVVAGGVRGMLRERKVLDAEAAANVLREAAGAVGEGARRTVLIEKAEPILRDPDVLQSIADADALTIFESFSRSKANRVDIDVVRRLGEATKPEDVSEILLREVATGAVREQGFYSGMGRFRQRVADSHLSGVAPRGAIHVDDKQRAAEFINSWAKQVKMDRKVRADLFARAVAAETQTDLLKVAEDLVSQADLGVDTAALTNLIKFTPDDFDRTIGRVYGIDESGEMVVTPHHRVLEENNLKIAPTAQLESELIKQGFELPDVVAVRRAANRAHTTMAVADKLGWEVGSNLARHVTRDVFKPAAILRPAYILRIGLEEQARLAFSGLDSIFNHPIRYLMANVRAQSWDAADRRTFERAMRAISNDTNLTDLDGEALEAVAEATRVMTHDAYGLTDDIGRSYSGARHYDVMPKNVEDPAYVKGWAHSLTMLAGDRAVRQLARNGGDVDAVVKWARETESGKSYIRRLSRAEGGREAYLTSDDALRENLQAALVRLHAMTGGETRGGFEVLRTGNADLIEAVGTGRAVNPNDLKPLADEFGPRHVKVEIADGARADRADGLKEMKDRTVDWLFDNITGKPTNYFARMPAFRQIMVRDFADSMRVVADDALRDELFERVVKSLAPTDDELRILKRSLEVNRGTNGIVDDLSELNDIVKHRAADQVKDLLFDVSTRSNAQVLHEVMFPFLDAWKEVTKTWSRLSVENAPALLRTMQGYQSLEQGGTIYTNDRGERVFAYPAPQRMMEWFSKATPGMDTSQVFEGRVEGVNLVAQGHGPGFGPVVTWGVGLSGFFDREGASQLKEWIAPFGSDFEDSKDVSPAGIVTAVTPAWAEKVWNALTSGSLDEHQWNSTVGDVAAALTVNPKYDPTTPDGRQRLMRDAESGARFTLLMRAFTQGVLLTGASSDWKIKEGASSGEFEVPEGADPKWHYMSSMASAWHEIQVANGFDSQLSTVQFIEQYGIEPFYVTQAKTKGVSELPVTTEGDRWVDRHKDAYERYPEVVGFFVPGAIADGEIDFDVFWDQMEDDDRVSLPAEARIRLGNRAKAYQVYSAARSAVEGMPTRMGQDYLRKVREALDEQSPGWHPNAAVPGVPDSMAPEEKIKLLLAAAQDPVLSDSPLMPPLNAYLEVRQQAYDLAAQRGEASTLSAEANADIAAWLREAGESIAMQDQTKTFQSVWNRLLIREVEA